MILAAGNDSCYYVNGIPYQRGLLIPVFNSTTGKCSLRYKHSLLNEIDGFGNFHYSTYIDASTGNPFATFDALVAWFVAYAFAGIVSGGTGSGLTYSKVFYIVAAPAADDEKAAGDTFQDDWLIGKTVTLMIVNNANVTGASIDHDNVTGDIGVTGVPWAVNDVVVIFVS